MISLSDMANFWADDVEDMSQGHNSLQTARILLVVNTYTK